MKGVSVYFGLYLIFNFSFQRSLSLPFQNYHQHHFAPAPLRLPFPGFPIQQPFFYSLPNNFQLRANPAFILKNDPQNSGEATVQNGEQATQDGGQTTQNGGQAIQSVVSNQEQDKSPLGDLIMAIPFLPFEINVPDVISSIVSRIQDILGGIRLPFFPSATPQAVMMEIPQGPNGKTVQALVYLVPFSAYHPYNFYNLAPHNRPAAPIEMKI